jgi:UDP-glucose:(heptosyl)LPS alpha-1,3-glucosyltransferase
MQEALVNIMKLGFIKKRFSIHGGAERYLQTLIEQFKRAGHEIHVFSNRWLEEEGIIFHKVDVLSLSSFLSVMTFNSNVRKAIEKSDRLDCIISFERTDCQDIYRAGEGCHSEWLEIRSKIEPFYKNLSFRINPLHISLLNLEKKIFQNTRLIIANSGMVKNQIIKHYAVPEEKIKIIYNGVDLKRFAPENKDRWRENVRKDLAIPADSKVLLFVGTGFKRKGLAVLIKSVPLIQKENSKSDVRVLVIGRDNIKKYSALSHYENVSDKIIFPGAQKEIEKFYAAADLFVLPTLYDPFSNACLEAMAAGLPVITTKNNGAAELIENGQQGFVMDSLSDASELADRVNLSIGNLKVMGEQARGKAEKFSIEKAACEFAEAVRKFVPA